MNTSKNIYGNQIRLSTNDYQRRADESKREASNESYRQNKKRLSIAVEQNILNNQQSPQLNNFLTNNERYSRPNSRRVKNLLYQPDRRLKEFLEKEEPKFKGLEDEYDMHSPSHQRYAPKSNLFSNMQRRIQNQAKYNFKIANSQNQNYEYEKFPEIIKVNDEQSREFSMPRIISSRESSMQMNDQPDIKIYAKPDYNQDGTKRVYREEKEKARLRTFNEYNKFDLKNFDVKTDGSLVEYKPEFHQNGVVSNISF